MLKNDLLVAKRQADGLRAEHEELQSRLTDLEEQSVVRPGGALVPVPATSVEAPPPTAQPLELQQYLRMVQQGWWIIALTTLSAIAIALLASYLATPLYKASSQLILSPNVSLSGSQAIYGLDALSKRSMMTTYTEILGSDRIFDETVAALQLDPLVAEKYTRSNVAIPEANILELSVTGPDPEIAALLGNSISQRTIEYVKRIYEAYEVNFLYMATAPDFPVSPQPVQSVSLAAGLGLILGITLAVLRGFLQSYPLEVLQRRMEGNGAPATAAPLSPTKAFFLQRLEEELSRDAQAPLSVALIRLDSSYDLPQRLSAWELKATFDRVLEMLRYELRGKDVVVQWDDNTIGLLLPSVRGEAAMRALDPLRYSLARLMQLEHQSHMVQLDPRVGIATRRGGESHRTLVDQAEQALRDARQDGHTCVLFSPDPRVTSA